MIILLTLMFSLPSGWSGEPGSVGRRGPLVLDIGSTTSLVISWKCSTSASVTSRSTLSALEKIFGPKICRQCRYDMVKSVTDGIYTQYYYLLCSYNHLECIGITPAQRGYLPHTIKTYTNLVIILAQSSFPHQIWKLFPTMPAKIVNLIRNCIA